MMSGREEIIDNEKLLVGFQTHLRYERTVSPRTIELHSIAVRRFSQFCKIPLIEVAPTNIMNYLKYLSDKKLKPASIICLITGIKVFYNWLAGEECLLNEAQRTSLLKLNHYLATRIKIKRPKNTPIFPLREEVERIRDCMEKALMAPQKFKMFRETVVRDRAMIETLIATGLRSGELQQLQKDNIDLKAKTITGFKGKGDKERPVLFNGKATKALKEYLKGMPKDRPIFDVSHDTVNLRIKIWTRWAKIKKRITAHSFRHYCCTNLLEQNMPEMDVADLMGHASLNSTRVYRHLSIVTIKKRYDKCDI